MCLFGITKSYNYTYKERTRETKPKKKTWSWLRPSWFLVSSSLFSQTCFHKVIILFNITIFPYWAPVNTTRLGLISFLLFVDELGGEEPRLADAQRRPWCPSKKQVFGGSCSNEDGGQECLNDLLSTWDPSVRLSPIYCDCIAHHKHKRMRICNCPNLICP